MELTEIKEKTLQALNELLEQANLKKDDIFVLGMRLVKYKDNILVSIQILISVAQS